VRNRKVILKYAAIQLAQLVVLVGVLMLIWYFTGVPTWILITVIALWILKDIALFPKVWKAYAVDDNSPTRQLIGLEATVIYGLDPVGFVRVQGELWKAELRNPRHPAKKGDRTRVVDVKGMTLIVEGCNDL
jgi:membrane protein implicated in regulation of membrane protease activity